MLLEYETFEVFKTSKVLALQHCLSERLKGVEESMLYNKL